MRSVDELHRIRNPPIEYWSGSRQLPKEAFEVLSAVLQHVPNDRMSAEDLLALCDASQPTLLKDAGRPDGQYVAANGSKFFLRMT